MVGYIGTYYIYTGLAIQVYTTCTHGRLYKYILHVHMVSYIGTYYIYTGLAIQVYTTCTHGRLYRCILHVHMEG